MERNKGVAEKFYCSVLMINFNIKKKSIYENTKHIIGTDEHSASTYIEKHR